MKTKRNKNNERYVQILHKLNEWQAKHPGQPYPAKLEKQLRKIAKRYAAHRWGEE